MKRRQITWTYNNGQFEYQGKDGEQLVWDTTTAGASTHWEGDKQWKDDSTVLFSATDADNEVLIGSDLQVLSMQVNSGGGYHFSSSTAEGWTLNVGELVVDENVTMEFDENVHLSFGSLTVTGASSTERNTMILKGGAEVDNFSNNTNVDYVLGDDLILHGWTGAAADSVRFSKVDGVTDPVFVEFDFSEVERQQLITVDDYSFSDLGLRLKGKQYGSIGRRNPDLILTLLNDTEDERTLQFPAIDIQPQARLRITGYDVTTKTLNVQTEMLYYESYAHDNDLGEVEVRAGAGRSGSLTVEEAVTGDGLIFVSDSELTLKKGGHFGSLTLLRGTNYQTKLKLGGDLELCRVGQEASAYRSFEVVGSGVLGVDISLLEGTEEAFIMIRPRERRLNER